MQLLNIKHQTRSALMRPGVSFQTKALRFCHKLPQFSVRTGASSGYKSVFDLIKDSPTLAAEEKLSMLGQLHSDEMRAAEARARAEAEKARAEVEKAAKLKNELYAARTDTARALGLLHMRGLIGRSTDMIHHRRHQSKLTCHKHHLRGFTLQSLQKSSFAA